MDSTSKLQQALNSLSVVLNNVGINNFTPDSVSKGNLHIRDLEHLELFARHAREELEQLQQRGAVPTQRRMSDPLASQPMESIDRPTLGHTADVSFPHFNKTVKGKVDTGATTSSLDAHNIKIKGNSVTFMSPHLSDKVITMDLIGHQSVQSADNNGEERPIVSFDVQIDGHDMENVSFNLNDRSHMDVPILLGQNVIKDGNFLIDVDKHTEQIDKPTFKESYQPPTQQEDKIAEAVNFLREQEVTLQQLYLYLRTDIINNLKD